MPELVMQDRAYLSQPFSASHINKAALLEVVLFHIAIAALLFQSWTGVTQHEPDVKTVNIRMVELPQPLKKPVIEPIDPVVKPEPEPVITPEPAPKKTVVENELAFKRVEKPIKKPAPKPPVKKQIEKIKKPVEKQPAKVTEQAIKQITQTKPMPDKPVQAPANSNATSEKLLNKTTDQSATDAFSVESYKPIEKQVPDYPRGALRKGLEGDCTVRYTVNAQGRVESAEALSDCHPLFKRPSLAAAQTFRYSPRMVNGKAVPVPNVRNTFEYRIH